MKSTIILFVFFCFSLCSCVRINEKADQHVSDFKIEYNKYSQPIRILEAQLESSPYPEWAHSHWVWLASQVENQQSEIQLVQDYISHDIPVGGVDIDSMWSTGVNNFVWNEAKFPNASDMISTFHSMNVRVICWTTSLVNTDSPSYEEGYKNGYYLEKGATVKWWHGSGSFIDYTNPDAMKWWHKQMDNVIDMGLDGWKCDGTDPFIFEWGGIAYSYSGFITEREYADYYYRDFFYYTRGKNPEALIMARPVDSYKFLYLSFAPHDVMFSGWVGDQDPTFDGMQDALRNMFHSAWRGYLNFGSDTGGYRHGNRTKELFIRWAQLSTFTPLMENGGEGEHRPWMYDQETLNIYRFCAVLHTEMAPYFLSTATECYAKGVSVMTPIAEDTIFTPSTWDFKIGKTFFISPVVTSGAVNQTVHFPKGDNWLLIGTNTVYQGGSKATIPLSFSTYPAFLRKGSIVPLNVNSKYSMFGTESSSDAITFLIHPSVEGEKVNLHEWKGKGMSISYNYDESTKSLEIIATAYRKPVIIILRNTLVKGTIYDKLKQKSFVQLPHNERKNCFDSLASLSAGFCVDKESNDTIIRSKADDGLYLTIGPVTFGN